MKTTKEKMAEAIARKRAERHYEGYPLGGNLPDVILADEDDETDAQAALDVVCGELESDASINSAHKVGIDYLFIEIVPHMDNLTCGLSYRVTGTYGAIDAALKAAADRLRG